MLEISVRYLEGLNFHMDIKVIEPREKLNGVYVEYLDNRTLHSSPEMPLILKAIGMKRAGYCLERDTEIWAWQPWGYIQYRLIHWFIKTYWWLLRWLYDNARMFKQIPPGTMFSWKYFTPYTWLRRK